MLSKDSNSSEFHNGIVNAIVSKCMIDESDESYPTAAKEFSKEYKANMKTKRDLIMFMIRKGQDVLAKDPNSNPCLLGLFLVYSMHRFAFGRG